MKTKFIITLAFIGFLSSCSSADDGKETGENENGELVFWTEDLIGHDNFFITISSENLNFLKVSQITKVYTEETIDCNSDGCAKFTLPPGNYKYSISLNTETDPEATKYDISVSSNGCTSTEVTVLVDWLQALLGEWRPIYAEEINLNDCTLENEILIFPTNGQFQHRYFKYFNDVCQLDDDVNGTYTISNNIIHFSDGPVGSPEDAQLLSLTANRLILKTVDNHGEYTITYAKQ